MKPASVLVAIFCGVLMTFRASAADLYGHDNTWSALAADRTARNIGDVLTVEVYNSATAIDSANTGSSRNSGFGGQISAGSAFSKTGSLSMNSSSDNSGTTGRSGGIVAELSVVVDEVYSNGDMHVSGSQVLKINGEETTIDVKGRVRLSDVSASNMVLSSRLAEASINYDGDGFVSRSAASGVLTDLFNWLGLP